MSVIFHCVRFRVSGIIHYEFNPSNGISGLVNKSNDQNVLFSGIMVYHLGVYILGYPCLDQSMTPRLRSTSLLNRLVADTC